MTEDEPHDRLTRLCNAAITAFEQHPEYRDGDQAIIMLDDDKMGGIVFHGYGDVGEAAANLLDHVRALFAANDINVRIVFPEMN